MKVIVENHYLKRKCPCSQAFGLYIDSKESSNLFEKRELVGVIVFGKPASYTLCNGIAGKEESKNVESWFVSRALKECDYDIVVSFADTEQGHVGYIYQATNWLYCGKSKKQKYFRLKSDSKNNGGTEYKRRERMPKSKIIEIYGEEFVEEYFSSLKYRYMYFNGSKTRKKQLIKKLKYKILPYPKNV